MNKCAYIFIWTCLTILFVLKDKHSQDAGLRHLNTYTHLFNLLY